MKITRWSRGVVLAGVVSGCAAPPDGLARTDEGDGPRIVFEFERRPLPEIPFPNDIATRPDPGSPTGLRVNASLVAATELESTARRRLDELSGFGVYQPIQVRFDAPLDLGVIYDRHRDYRNGSGADYEFRNDAVFVIDVTVGSPTYLQPVPLDFGEGNFPQLLRTPSLYWEHDPKTVVRTLSFETYEEDWNQNGELDPGEDLDLDGVLDHPNVHPLEDGDPTLDPVADLVTFYEFETDTLIFKPIVPLREKTTYAVVLTKRLIGADGDAIRSPFAFVNHTDQTEELRPALVTLEDYGLDIDDVAFAWTFTTQDATGDLVTLRNGMYGEGPAAWLAQDNPPELSFVFPMLNEFTMDGQPNTNRYVLPSEVLRPVLAPFAEIAFADLGLGGLDPELLIRNLDFYAYHVSGTFKSPRLLDLDATGNLDARAWPGDLTDPALRDKVVYDDVQFWCSIPRPEYKPDPSVPAPVVLYAHGYTSNKMEPIGLAVHAKFGIASCGMDAVGHGIDVGDNEMVVRGFLEVMGMGPGADALLHTRAVDVDFDGVVDVGSEVLTGYMFRTRDNLRQTVLDWLHLARLLRSFGSGQMLDVNGDGVPELSGDFNADGLVDLGGRDVELFASGTSLGGLVSSVLAGIEPRVVAAAPISGGAGLVDLTSRSEQGGAVEAVALRLFGPMILGEPSASGGTRIYSLFVNGNKEERRDLAFRAGVEPGDVVMVTNVRSGEARCARVMPELAPPGYEALAGWSKATCSANDVGQCRECVEGTEGTYACDLARTFRVGVPADRGDPLRIEVWEGPEPVRVSGDERDCVVRDGARLRTAVEAFELPGDYRGTAWAAGDTLVALEDGYGFQRGTPGVRRFINIAAMSVDQADPAAYAPHYSRVPLILREDGEEFENPPTSVLNIATVGDPQVPVNTGIAIAKVAGFIELQEPDVRYGKTVNRVLIDEGVQQGIPWLATRPEWGPVLVDVDNISASANVIPMDPTGSNDGKVAPRLDPVLRIIVRTPGTPDSDPRYSGLVLPMINEFDGAHGFSPPGIFETEFDVGQFMEHQIGWFFATRGREVRYDVCMAELDACAFVPSPPAEP